MKIFLLIVVANTMPKFVQGLINLANDAMNWILAASVVIAGVMGTYRAVQWYTADDGEKAPAAKRIKVVVIGAIMVVVFESALKLVLSYFN